MAAMDSDPEITPTDQDQPTLDGIWNGIFGWRSLFRWDVLGAIVPGLFIAIGGVLLGIDWFWHNLLLSQICFSVAAVLCIIKFIGHAIEASGPPRSRIVFACIMSFVVLAISIPGLLIIERHKADLDHPKQGEQKPTAETKGFMQLGDAWFVTRTLAVGPPLAINLSLMNKGNVPVDDMYGFFGATLTPRGPDGDATDRKVHADFLRGALKSQDQAINDGKSGQSLGKGESLWTTMTFKPLTTNDVNGLMSGEARLYVYVWSRWRDSPHDLDTCLWLQPPPTPDISDFKKLTWHECSR
jgi:hypothetical protein